MNLVSNINVAETAVSNEKKNKSSMEVMNIKKRMVGGADDKTGRSLTGAQDNSSIEKSAQQVGSNVAEDFVQYRNATSTLNSVRGQIGSEARLSSVSLQGKDISTKTRRSAVNDGPICLCPSMLNPGKPAAGKFDEMIEYALKNLNEADKGLNNLGDNFEHDLRLMFMDIMGRVQHWVSVVQNRIHAARADIESLKKESVARVSDLTAKDLELVELKRRLNEAETKLAVQTAQEKERLIVRSEVTANYPGRVSLDQGKETVSTSVQTISNSKNAVTSPINTVCQSAKDLEERSERETELETEIAQLREENESMLKEREEYENAIQCALLRGVSSLNLEAFKVLRCPPIPCCKPCVLSTQNSALGSSSCPSSHATPQPAQRKSNAIPKNARISDDNQIRRRNGVETKSCLSCLADEGNKGPVENNLILLLHDGDAAAGNFHCMRPCRLQSLQPQPIISGSMDNKETSVCVGGKCKKSAGIKTPRVPKSPPAMSRPGSCDLFVRMNRDDPASEKITAKKNNAITNGKRCNVCLTRNSRK